MKLFGADFTSPEYISSGNSRDPRRGIPLREIRVLRGRVRVTDVEANSVFYRAGLRRGDTVENVGTGRYVSSAADIRAAVLKNRGGEIKLTILRGPRTMELTVALK